MPEYPFVPYSIERLPDAEMLRRGREICAELALRRSVRQFSPDPVPAN